jgi:DNA-directed RNA polymerase subunit RPC12/RpoP
MRLIDADALIQKRAHAKAYDPDMYVIGQGYVMDAPTVDPVRGRWVKRTNPQWPAYTHDVCSVCGWENSSKAAKYRDFPYCPNCGSRMDEDGGRKDG